MINEDNFAERLSQLKETWQVSAKGNESGYRTELQLYKQN